ncbi:MAG: polysaccharide biosynthesis/export family protein [Planctomycetota bacterium]|jgi:polysaccharide export outer membrane protein
MRLERLVGGGLILLAACRPAAAEERRTDPERRVDEERVYLISPGDTIDVFVAERPDLSTQVRIPLEGRIIIPGAGAVRAAGRGVEELSLEIARRLEIEARLVKPRVAVSVVSYGSRRAFVYGAVVKAQAVELPAERPLTLTQVVAASGGFRPDADRERVRITRRSGTQGPRSFEVDAQKTAEGDEPEGDPVLEPGDTVYVPMREPVYVLGQVKSAGAHPVPYGYPLTVSKAVALSGGLDKFARYTRVVVTRRTGKETETFSVNLGAVFEGKLDEDMELRPGDTVFVPERRF